MARITIGTPALPPVRIDGLTADVEIQYVGSAGRASRRRVTVHGADGRLAPDGTIILDDLRGYCHLRKMARTFRFDRIQGAADADGAVIADLAGWLKERSEG